MKIEILRNLDIFTPELEIINAKLSYKKIINEDFIESTQSFFYVITNRDGSVWKYGTLFLLNILKSYKKLANSSIKDKAYDLMKFKEWCDEENIDYLSSEKLTRTPTYRFKNYLLDEVRNKSYSVSTARRKISTIVQFYEYLINIENINFKYPLWKEQEAYISFKNTYGVTQQKKVNSKDISRLPKSSKLYKEDNVIIDGGRLKPLSNEQRHTLLRILRETNNTEMMLGFMFSLLTGARMQTVFTLRVEHFKKEIIEDFVRLRIGFGTNIDTKYDKLHILYIPKKLYLKIQTYLQSDRYNKRVKKSKHIFKDNDLQYVFLTNRGVPYYIAKNDPYIIEYEEPSMGATVRNFIAKTMIPKLHKTPNPFTFSFHDLRATYGLSLLEQQLKLVEEKNKRISDALFFVKERMGHESLQTTERYLNYRQSIESELELAQCEHEEDLWKVIEDD